MSKKTLIRSYSRRNKNGSKSNVKSHFRNTPGKKPDISKLNELHKIMAIKVMEFETDKKVRKESIDILGDSEDLSVLPVIEFSLLNDPEPVVRIEAAEEIGDIHHPSSLISLTIAMEDNCPKVREEVMNSINKIQDKNSKRKINKYLSEYNG